jgi:cytochrome c oxidase subunit IV
MDSAFCTYLYHQVSGKIMKKTIEIVWATLILLSLFAFLLGYLEFIGTILVGFLLLSTFIKGVLVIDYFMGLKEIQLRYRLIPMVWLSIVLSLIALAYYLPLSIT